MDGLENAMGLQHGNKGILNCPLWGLKTSVSEMTISSVSMAMPSGVANPFPASSAWDPLVSLSEIHPFGGSPMVSQGMSSNTQLVQHMSDSNFADMVPSYGIGSFLETGDIYNTVYQPDCYQSNEARIEKGPIINRQSQGEGSTPEEGEARSAIAPNENRKRGPDCNYTLSPNKKAEGDAIEDSGKCSDGVKEQNKKKPKVEQKSSASLRAKQSTKQEKDDSHSGKVPEENFVHVRARKGQATSNHSLAERARREKISERMRLLQELVPGCNKITGKAVMLDEIINYVQSLQQQVEFLSMKLAIVNPELNFNVAKDILQSRIGYGPIGGYGTPASMPSTSTQFPKYEVEYTEGNVK